MGQRKTWSLHHVPFSMLWETMTLDYKDNWDSVVNSLTAARFLEAANDRQYKNSFFAFTWKSRYLSTSFRKGNLKTGKGFHLSTKGINFNWIRNANKGSNETSCSKSHYVCFDSEVFLLNLFFRQKIHFEDKKANYGYEGSVSVTKAHLVSCFALKQFIRETVEGFHVFLKNRHKRKAKHNFYAVRRSKVAKLFKLIPKFTRSRVRGFSRLFFLKKKISRSRRRLKRGVRSVRPKLHSAKKDPLFWGKALKRALTCNFKIPRIFKLL